jgi:hypothetical protein
MIPRRGLRDIRTPSNSLPSRDGITPLKARTKLLSFQVEKNHLEKELKRLEERLKTINARLGEIRQRETNLYPIVTIDATPPDKGERGLPEHPPKNGGPLRVKERLMNF